MMGDRNPAALVASAIRARASWLRPGLFFFAACVLAYGLEHLSEKMVVGGATHSEVSQSIFSVRGVYQYLVSAWPRKLVPRYTVLVSIDGEHDPASVSLHELCRQREFIGRLVTALADRAPAVIVVDKYFGANRCHDEPERTRALQASLAAVSARLPVVVGLSIDAAQNPSRDGEGRVWRISEPLSFDGAARPREGIVNIDPDSRRLALGWRIAHADAAQEVWRNALALEAALAYDSLLPSKYPQIDKLIAKRTSPYLSLMPETAFVNFRAGDVLCAADRTAAKCAGRTPPPAPGLDYLRGRIVIVGEVHASDRHQTVIGSNVPGYVLQANYVEALLDERYFAPVPWWMDYAVGFLFFVAIEWSLRQRTALRCVGGVLGVIALTYLLLALTVRHLGYYLNPVTVSAFILALKLITWLSERIARQGESRDHH